MRSGLRGFLAYVRPAMYRRLSSTINRQLLQGPLGSYPV